MFPMGNYLNGAHMSLTLLSNQNHLTIEEHILKILEARTKMDDGFYSFIESIRDAYEQLPTKSFQNELGERLNMKRSVLSKWVSISRSSFIEKHIRKLPPSLSTLYTITLIEKKYEQMYSTNFTHHMNQLVTDELITITTDRNECELILKRITQDIRLRTQLIRHDNLLSLSGGTLAPGASRKTLTELIEDKLRFRSFVVIPTDEQISLWGDNGYFQMDIANDFPLHDLRTPSIIETISCLIKVRMNKIDVGIKLLSTWGFSYRNSIVPPLTNSYCSLLDDEYVIVRGERGQEKKLSNSTCFTLDTEDLLDFVEDNYEGPNLLVFADTMRKDWSCTTQ